MAVKPVISIEVNDAAFQAFIEKFNEYQAQLAEMPEAWDTINAAMGGAGEALKTGAASGNEALAMAAAQAAIIAEELRHATKAQVEFARASGASHTEIKSMAKTVGGLGKTIFGMATNILKMGALGLGLGAIAGGFGFGELAGAALTRQKSAFGLGMTPGRLASFDINMQQFLTRGDLQAAFAAKSDVHSAGLLGTLGINFQQAQKTKTEDLAAQMLEAARKAGEAGQKQGLSLMQIPAVRSYLGLGGNLGQVQNAIMMGPVALEQARRDTAANASRYDISQQVVAAWATLKKAFDSAGFSIQTNFINALAKLAPELANLSSKAQDMIAAFLGSKQMDAVIGEVKDGLKGLGDFLQAIDWRKIGGDIEWFAGILGFMKPKPPPPDGSQPNPLGIPSDEEKANRLRNLPGVKQVRTTFDDLGASWKEHRDAFYDTLGGMLGKAGKAVSSGMGEAWHWANSPITAPAGAAVLKVAKEKGVDPILALAAGIKESGLDPNAKGDKTKSGRPTSFGVFQLHEGGELGDMTPKQAFDATMNARVALSMFAQVAKKHPDWSPGQIAAAAQRPADPKGYAKEVNAIYDRLIAQMAKNRPGDVPSAPSRPAHPHPTNARQGRGAQKQVSVSVTNQTSARVAVSVNAAGAV